MHSLAVCAIIKNELSYLSEWIAYHRLAGAGLFRIYDHGSTDGTAEFLHSLGRLIPVEVVDWSHAHSKNQGWQVSAYEDATSSLTGRAQFVAYIDVDEFLVTEGHRPIPDVLSQFSDLVALASNQRIYGSGGQVDREPGLVTERFTMRMPIADEEGCWIKTIARPEAIARWTSSHSVELKDNDPVLMTDGKPLIRKDKYPGQADRVAVGPLWHNHYMLKSLEEFRSRQAKGHPDDIANYKRFHDGYFSGRDKRATEVDHHMLPMVLALKDLTELLDQHTLARNRFALGGVSRALLSYLYPSNR